MYLKSRLTPIRILHGPLSFSRLVIRKALQVSEDTGQNISVTRQESMCTLQLPIFAPANDTWYVSVYTRDMNPPNRPPGAPPNWSPLPVKIFDSQPNIGGHYDNLNVGPVNWVANIPIDLLWYPQTLPNPLPPGVPQQITLTFESLRQTILRYR